MVKQAKNNEKRILLRLPATVAKEIKRRADKFRRSVNGQIVYELDPHYDEDKV